MCQVVLKLDLIAQSKLPKRDNVAVASLYIVFHDIALFGGLYLLLLSIFSQ